MRWIFIFVCLSLFAEIDEFKLLPSTSEEIATLFTDQSSLIGGVVSPMNGQLCLRAIDVIARGTQDIPLSRIYLPPNLSPPFPPLQQELEQYMRERDFLLLMQKNYRGWLFFPHLYLERLTLHQTFLSDSNGAVFTFSHDSDGSNAKLSALYGISNAPDGIPQGQFDKRNIHFIYADKAKISFPNGLTRIYTPLNRKIYRLDKEIHPNGKIFKYHYHPSSQQLLRIDSLDPKERVIYASLNIEGEMHSLPYRLKNDLKKSGITTIDSGRAPEYLIKKATSSIGDTATYTYKPISREKNPALKKKSGTFKYNITFPSVLEIASTPNYRLENLIYEDFQLTQYSAKEQFFNCSYKNARVETLSFPSEENDAMKVIYTMSYDPPIAGIRGGKTVVIRADQMKMEYHFSKELLVDSILSYAPEGDLKKQKIYHWSSDHRLQSIDIKDGDVNPFYSICYENYDDFGNPRIEKFTGDLTGENKIESYTIKRTYSTDHWNLLLREENEEGQVTTYEYLKGTNLPTQKLVLENESIKLREFWTYDDYGNLQRKTIDNGSAKDIDKFDDITQRMVTQYHLREKDPFLHKPDWIEELIWEETKEVLLRKTVLSYDQWGNIAEEQVFNPQGALISTISRKYDEQGNILSNTNPLGYTSEASYTLKGQLKTSTNFSQTLKTKRDYGARGHLKKLEDVDLEKDFTHRTTFKYNLLDQCIKKTDYLGHSTIYEHDPISGVVKLTEGPSIISLDQQELKVKSSSTFDGLGRKLTDTDPNGHLTTYKYNAYGSPKEIIYPDGSKEIFIYYKNGKLKSHTDPFGLTTKYKYDLLSHLREKEYFFADKLLAKETFIYNAFNLLLEHIDKEGRIIKYGYDGGGRKISEAICGRITIYDYDFLGFVQTINYNNLFQAEYDRDPIGRVLEERKKDPHGKTLFKIGYDWDPDGQQIATIRYPHNTPAKEILSYDPFGRITKHEDALGFATTTIYKEEPFSSISNEQPMDAKRKLISISTDPNGIITTKTFDPYERIALLQIGTSYIEKSLYDAAGNLIQTEEDSLRTRYTYNNRDRKETLIRAYGTPDARTTTYLYKPRGELAVQTLPNGTTLTYTYTPFGYPLTVNTSDGFIRQMFEYTLNGHLHIAKDGNHILKRDLDDFGNVLSETIDNLFYTKTYDSLNRLETITFLDKSTLVFTYNPVYLETVTRFSANQQQQYQHTYESYDLAGNLLSEQLPYKLGTIFHTWNPNGTQASLASHFFDQVIKYESDSRVQKISSDGKYRYNDLSEIIQEEFPQNIIVYDYDRHHNRKQKNERFFTYNSLDEPDMLKHDLNGNLKENGNFTYNYDALGRLTEVTGEDGQITFAYDALDRRIFKTVDGLREFYLYHGTEELGTFYADGTAKNVRVPGLYQKPIALELEEQPLIPLCDYRGNVRRLLDPQGQIVQSHNYTAFGEELAPIITPFNPWRYSAKYFDPDLGLYYHGKRFYNPTLGRWLTPDPAGFIDGTNLYQYAYNNPLSYNDLTGESAGGYLLGLGEIILGGTIMAGGLGLELVTFGGFTFGLGVTTGTGALLIGHGLSMTTYHAQDMKAPTISCKNTNPFDGPVDGEIFVGDAQGNIIPVPAGYQLGGSKDGKCIQQKDKDGKQTGIRKDGKGHPASPVHEDPRAQNPHAHVPGITNSDGTPWLPITTEE